jgi:diguanylate cyclase (GGDEF)-like protein
MGAAQTDVGPAGMASERLSAFLEAMGAGAAIWDSDLRLVAWNNAYRTVQQIPDRALKAGMSLAALFERCPHLLEERRTARDTEASALQILATDGKLDVDRVLPDGRTIAVTYDRFGADHWIAIYHDVTAQRNDMRLLRISERTLRLQHDQLRARETELKVQQRLLEAALDNMSRGLCIFDSNAKLVISNRQYAEMYRLPPELLRPGTDHDAILTYRVAHGVHTRGDPRGYMARRKEIVQKQAKANDIVEMQDGRTLSVTHDPMEDGGWVATHEDITERVLYLRQLEERERDLAHQNMRFSAAVNMMSHGLCMFDADRRLVICNSQYARIYGLTPDMVRPGTPLTAILEYRRQHGFHPVGGIDSYFQHRVDLAASRKEATDVTELQDGRVISILHHPMADGGWVSTHQDITEQRRHEAHIRHLARHDSLTDLPNRLMFGETMETAEQRIRRRERLAVLAVDLDHFKMVNDTLGHGVGDKVLAEVGRRLRSCCREGDEVSRLGGDEFAVLTGPIETPRDAAAIAARIISRMSEPFEIDGHSIVIGASVGIAVAPGDGATSETLLKNADLALYRAKNSGRGAYHFFESGMDASLQERRTLEVGLRQALANREFRLVFQPIFNLGESRICCLEALLRWERPGRGPVPPDEFIPVAEETGIIGAIGEWVLVEACRAAANWPENVHVAVNLSTVQFRNRNLFNHIKTALAVSGLPPERLELEVTESLMLADVETTVSTLHQLRALGVRISMDDFGTGYSSLSYLRSFPFDKIKIDRSFVKDLSAEKDSRAIVSAVIGLGRSLGMTITAEGVETEAQLDLVRQQGCTEVQGFLLSPPLPLSAVTKLFAESAGMEEWTRSLKKSA